MPADLHELCDDLLAETDVLAGVVGALDDAGWSTPTPAPGWTVRDQITHLARFDEMAHLAIVDPAAFTASRDEAIRRGGDLVDQLTEADRHRSGPEAWAWLRAARAALVADARERPPGERVPWYGPDMTIASSLTARIMETFAHGQDVLDALDVERVPTARLRHVAFIGARALPNSYVANGRPVPDVPVRVELAAPDGSTWAFGPDGAADVVRGPAFDFCLLVTQRRHRDDTALVATGPVADEWLSIAQAFAGAPGAGRPPAGATP